MSRDVSAVKVCAAMLIDRFSQGLNQFYTSMKKNLSTRKHSSTIRKNEPDFEPLLFAEIAQQKYIDAHQALME